MMRQERLIPSSKMREGGEDIPASEIELFCQQVRAHASYWDPGYIRKTYRKAGARVTSSPFRADALAPIITALERRTPFSAIRIGHGEANILAYAVFSDTPNLDGFAFERSVAQNPDSFKIGTLWMSILQEMMLSSILQADMVGVIGLWRFGHRSPPERLDEYLKHFASHRDLDGLRIGQFTGLQTIMRLASQGILKEKFSFLPISIFRFCCTWTSYSLLQRKSLPLRITRTRLTS